MTQKGDLATRAARRRETFFRDFPDLEATFLNELGEDKTALVFQEMERRDERRAERQPRSNPSGFFISTAIAVLRAAGRPMSLAEIVVEMEANGAVFGTSGGSSTKANSLGAMLNKRAKKCGDVAKLGSGRPVLWTAARKPLP